ncbi:MAG: M20/M25/M40 family metallo-hydrolase [Aridibacter sp.]
MTKFKRISAMLFVFAMILQLSPAVFAQFDNKDAEVYVNIRKEAMENSKIMNTLHNFTDVYGPRLTGSPKLEMAGKWAMKQMNDWGFDKTEMEPWDFGNVGWENDRAYGFITSPVKDQLTFEVLAWTPSTKGVVKGKAVMMEIPLTKYGDDPRCVRPPTEQEFNTYLASMKSKVSGNMVLFGEPASPGVEFDPPNKRLNSDDIEARRNPRRRNNVVTDEDRPTCPKLDVTPINFRAAFGMANDFILNNGAAVNIQDARMVHGKIRAFSNRTYDLTKAVPTAVMRNEDYGRIWRLLKDGRNVELEFNIQNSIYPQGKTAYNIIGEIKGTDKADEVIMLGGHLDSWHAATGATDNAIGCAIMMEAARILKAVGVKPRRTVRVALWSGEEQGLLGSQAYVEKHFGSFENPKPAYNKFGGYFNVDSGTGRVRGWSVFGPEEAAQIVGNATGSFTDLGFIAGVTNTTSRGLGGSDHTSFNQAGLPGIGALQDPIEYFTDTWHTNLDTYERIVEEDVKVTAAIVASAVYKLSMRDELLPRLPKDKMPALRGR